MTQNKLIVAILLLALAVAVGFLFLSFSFRPAYPLGSANNDLHADLGVRDLDDGPVTLRHTYRISNARGYQVRAVDVVRSCGCLESMLDSEVLAPGDTSDLTLAAVLSSPGTLNESCTVLFDDGSKVACTLRAVGRLSQSLELILVSKARSANTVKIIANAYFVDSDGGGQMQPPLLLSPLGGRLTFDGWTTIERHDPDQRIPSRQVGRLLLEVNQEDLLSAGNVIEITTVDNVAAILEV